MEDAAARALIASVTEPLAELELQANLAYWAATTTGADAAARELAARQAERARFLADPATFAALAAARVPNPPSDPLVQRQIELLYRAFLRHQMQPPEIDAMVRQETELEQLFSRHRAHLQGRTVTDNDLRELLQREDDAVLRREAWEASKAIGAAAAPRVVALARLRNAVARRLGFRDYFAFSLYLQELDENDLFRLLDEVATATAGPYARRKADLDRERAHRFAVAPGDLLPWHYDNVFFQDLPGAGSPALDALFTGMDIAATCDRFFSDIGLPVTAILARSDLYEREGKLQHAYCAHLDRQGDVRILANLRPTEQWCSTLLHELGHAAYDAHHDPALPWVLATPAHTFTTEAVAMLMELNSLDGTWLQAYAGAGSDLTAELAAARRHTAANLLVFIRWALVVVHFERELYRDPDQDLNAVWRRLVEGLQLLCQPPGRNAPDWAAKIHIATAPVYYQNYILGRLLAAQMATAMAGDTGTAILTGNPDAGAWLRERVFAPGASLTWAQLVRRATGADLSPAAFVEQCTAS